MIVTQTIKLEEKEKEALATAFSIIDRMSDLAHNSMTNVFEALIDNYTNVVDEYDYSVRDVIEISKIS